MMISPILLNIMDSLCVLCVLEGAQATGRETNILFELSALCHLDPIDSTDPMNSTNPMNSINPINLTNSTNPLS